MTADEIKAALRDRALDVCQHLLPAGQLAGDEYKVGSLAGEAGESLNINIDGKAGLWCDFASPGASGDNLLELWRQVRGIDFAEAMREAAEWLGVRPAGKVSSQPMRPVMIPPIPDDAPKGHPKWKGKPAGVWCYTDAAGSPAIIVYRYNTADDKVFFQFDYQAKKWIEKGGHRLPDPRPLYRLGAFATRPASVIVLVEGEGCVHALASIGIEASTTLGGSGQVDHGDFSPLQGWTVISWPDADTAGTKYADKAAAKLRAANAAGVRRVRIPDGVPEKWDAADAVRDGWDRVRIQALLDSAESLTEAAEEPRYVDLDDVPPLDVFGDSRIAGSPELPSNALPDVIAQFALDEAARLGVDYALIAIPCLAVAAAAIDDRFVVQPKEKDADWTESSRLWVAAVSEPGEKKTPAIKKATSPLREAEKGWFEQDQIAKERYEAAKRKHTHELEQFARGKRLEPPATPERPCVHRYIVSDTTIESLSEILQDNPRGLLCYWDELSGWFASFDAYRGRGGGKDRALWLELYNGGSKPIDRVMRGRVLVPNWSACLLGGIQPGPMQRLARKVTDDGLLQRFIVFFPRPAGGEIDRAPNYSVIGAYRQTVARLLAMVPDRDQVVFTLSEEAQRDRSFVARVARNAMLLPDTSASFRAHLGKWEGLFARLALTFHLVEAAAIGSPPRSMITGQVSAQVARLMIDYLLHNAARFYSELLGQEHLVHARWVAGYILAHRLDRITTRDVGRGYGELRGQVQQIAKVMETLVLAGWLTEIDSRRGGGLSAKWKVNPRVHTAFAARAAEERRRRDEVQGRIKRAAVELGLVKEAVGA